MVTEPFEFKSILMDERNSGTIEFGEPLYHLKLEVFISSIKLISVLLCDQLERNQKFTDEN